MSGNSSPVSNDEPKRMWRVEIRSYQFACFVAAFLLIAISVAFHLTDTPDMAAASFFHNLGSATLDGLMIGITLAGDLTTIFAVAIVLTILRRTRKLGLAILISLVVTSVLLMYVKPLVARPLPPFEFKPRIKLPDQFTLEQDVIGFTHVPYSFPSGHETRAASLSLLVGLFLSKRSHKAAHIVWVYPVVIAVSRLYLAAHYPFDLIASVALGIVISFILVKVLKLNKGKMSDTLFTKARDPSLD